MPNVASVQAGSGGFRRRQANANVLVSEIRIGCILCGRIPKKSDIAFF
jgi:hypothetical protein